MRRVGNMIQEGPSTIHAADSVGTSYVEASTSLFWRSEKFSNLKSCRIYCDACGDEEFGFLNPIARIASWNIEADFRNVTHMWPNVIVKLIELPLGCPEIDGLVQRTQKKMETIKLSRFGLPDRRNFGDFNSNPGGHIRIETEAGWQSLIRSFYISEAPEFSDTLSTFESVIYDVGQSVDTANWVERYDYSPAEKTERFWEWNYLPCEFR